MNLTIPTDWDKAIFWNDRSNDGFMKYYCTFPQRTYGRESVYISYVTNKTYFMICHFDTHPHRPNNANVKRSTQYQYINCNFVSNLKAGI